MPTPTKGARLGGSPAHQKAILSNLATSLFEHGAITTTEAKARRLRPFAEKLISKAKRGDLHNRRQVLSVVRDKGVVHTLFTEIGPRYADRPGGYTRITKIGPRKGDNAPMAVIALVEEELTSQTRTTRQRSRTAGQTAAPAAARAAAATTPVDGAPVDGAPVDGATVDGAPVDEAPVDGATVDEAPAEDQTAAGAAAVEEAAGAEEDPSASVVASQVEPDPVPEAVADVPAEADPTPDARGDDV